MLEEIKKKNFILAWLATKRIFISIIVNCALVTIFVCVLVSYLLSNQEKSNDQNGEAIKNVAIAKSEIVEKVYSYSNDFVYSAAEYCNQKSVLEALDYLSIITKGTSFEYQLLKSSNPAVNDTYVGYSSLKNPNNEYVELSYAYSPYTNLVSALTVYDENENAFGYCSAYTNPTTAISSYSIFKKIVLLEEGNEVEYFILFPQSSKSLIDKVTVMTNYTNLLTALISSDGSYLVAETGYRGFNFYDYIDNYNDLSLTHRIELRDSVLSDEDGVGLLFYKNSRSKLCTFAYSRCSPEMNCYVIVSVPNEDYVISSVILGEPFVLIIVLLLILLFNVGQLIFINKDLHTSANNERKANNAKSDFLSRMSHDIRTPLNGIVGLTALAQDEENPPKTQEYLEKINISSQFLTGLVNDILDVSRIEEGKSQLHLEPCTGEEFMKYLSAVIVPLAKNNNIHLTLNEPPFTRAVLVDRLRFNQILFNLLSNAIKYTPQGGEVSLNWDCKHLPNGKESITFFVKDNGIGMSEEFQKHMFEPFTQERAPQTSVTGAGLGLSIVNKLIQLMGGEIKVDSKKNLGSTFYVHLDVETENPVSDIQSETNSIDLSGKRVLICEDHKINILVVQRLLEKWGIITTIAENGKIGVEAFESSEAFTFDAILMDMRMPVMDGIVATQTIRALDRIDSKTVPIIAMTANAYDTDVKKCIDAGMNIHVSKPINPEELKLILAKEISQRDDR